MMYIFVGSNGNVVALSPADGREAWRTSLVEEKFFTIAAINYGVVILEHEDQVLALNSGRLFALDAATGNILWSFNAAEGKGKAFGVTLSVSGKSIKTETAYSGLGTNLP